MQQDVIIELQNMDNEKEKTKLACRYSDDLKNTIDEIINSILLKKEGGKFHVDIKVKALDYNYSFFARSTNFFELKKEFLLHPVLRQLGVKEQMGVKENNTIKL